jgi:aminodeoxyfutalosine deaminase
MSNTRSSSSDAFAPESGPAPKIELHVHLEGAVRPKDLLDIAARNGIGLPADNEEDLGRLYVFRDFDHFVELWMMTTSAIRTERDFRQVVVSYAEEAASAGACYIEGIFTPAERTSGGASWDEVFCGFCDGAAEAKDRFGIEVRLTPDIPRSFGLDVATETARYAVKYRDRGVVGLGLGGPEVGFPPEPFERAFLIAKDGGIGSVPHAGEVAGAESVRGAFEALGADRIRHGIRSVDDPSLLEDLAGRQIVCDVCPVSNLRTGAVKALADHPLAEMLAAGVLCSISTDDPAMFATDLENEYTVASKLGCSAEAAFRAGIVGALCDETTRSNLRKIGDSYPWPESAWTEGKWDQ